MSIADLVRPSEINQPTLKTLAHVEFQLRVLGLICAASAGGPTELTTPGSLDVWSRYIVLERRLLRCSDCEAAALAVAESINSEVATNTSIRRMRNQTFHGGPDPENVDLTALRQVVAKNAEEIVKIFEHRHFTNLEPFFLVVNGELAALHDYSEVSASYWPRRGLATDVTEPDVLEALHSLGRQGGDRLLQQFATDIQKDLRGFAEPDSIQTLVDPPNPIIARWELRTSDRAIPRIDQFGLNPDYGRIWLTEGGVKPYREFLASVCNWQLLKERLLQDLEEQAELLNQISDQLFPDLKRHVTDVPSRVRVASGPFGKASEATIADACKTITDSTGMYSASTNLIVLTGEAGSGKTHSLLQFARASLAPSETLEPIAVYISSSGSSANSLDTLLAARVSRTRILEKSSVLALCRAGLAILVIDGFDELLGFRTYDTPLAGLQPILDAMRGKGTIILSARSSYTEARLSQSLKRSVAQAWPPYLTSLELLPWRPDQLQELKRQLSVSAETDDIPVQVQQLLTTPFFCLAFAGWAQSDRSVEFLQYVVDAYLSRERGKLRAQGGGELFSSIVLSDIFSEVAEFVARNVAPEISEEDLELAASSALGRELTKEESRRLVALCGMSAEWVEGDLSFKFTHLAVAEQFLARQVIRLPIDQGVNLLLSVPISRLCAQLVVSNWRATYGGEPTNLIEDLQKKVIGVEDHDRDAPGAVSLGELWAIVYASWNGPRSASRITLDDLELRGSGTVALDEATVQNLSLASGVKLLLTSSQIFRLDLSKSSGEALMGSLDGQVLEVMTVTELAIGETKIRRALGLATQSDDDFEEMDNYFKSNLILARAPIIVGKHSLAPEDDVRLDWITEYGIDEWKKFVRRALDEGLLTKQRVNASGPAKVRLKFTGEFDSP